MLPELCFSPSPSACLSIPSGVIGFGGGFEPPLCFNLNGSVNEVQRWIPRLFQGHLCCSGLGDLEGRAGGGGGSDKLVGIENNGTCFWVPWFFLFVELIHNTRFLLWMQVIPWTPRMNRKRWWKRRKSPKPWISEVGLIGGRAEILCSVTCGLGCVLPFCVPCHRCVRK